jgi:SAM-dependent methyltransferase
MVRYHLYRDVLLAFPRRYSCNICGWRGRRFLTYLDPFILCPQCGSHVRQRLIAAALQHLGNTLGGPAVWDRVLHISPEYSLGLTLRPRARKYFRADWVTADCDVRQDITSMPFRDGAFDALAVCDTLEHVVNDRAALAECRRVLRTGGLAIFTVPQNENRRDTHEDAAIVSKADRKRYFGQEDHVRNYGLDFGDRVAAAGFDVTCVDASSFDPSLVIAHVLRPPTAATSPVGWTNRRVYFARRT